MLEGRESSQASSLNRQTMQLGMTPWIPKDFHLANAQGTQTSDLLGMSGFGALLVRQLTFGQTVGDKYLPDKSPNRRE